LEKKNTPTAKTKAQLPGLWRTSEDFLLRTWGCFFKLTTTRERGEERRGERSRAH